MSFFVVEQLAVLSPQALAQEYPWLGGSARDWLSNRVLELTYTNIELAPFARDLGAILPPFRWHPERRVLLQTEIDAAVLHLYGLTRHRRSGFSTHSRYSANTRTVTTENFGPSAKCWKFTKT